MGKGPIIGITSIWVDHGHRVHYGHVFDHERVCNPLNLVSGNRTIEKVISITSKNKCIWSLLDLRGLEKPVGFNVATLGT